MNRKSVPSSTMVRRVLIASIVGNAFEWFDFAIYGLLVNAIAQAYFPAGDPLTSLMLAFATFGVGFVVRPVGGIIIGMYGDRTGRRKALSLTISLMALGTGVIGLLPSYATIGATAPIILVVARLIQGFSVGGEFSGATTILFEYAPMGRRGFFASFQMCSQALAFSAGAAAVFLLSSQLNTTQFNSWGWRLPFIVGSLLGPIGWIVRLRIDESPEFVSYVNALKRTAKTFDRQPLRALIKNYPRQLVASTGIFVVGTVSAYVFVFFLPVFANQRLGITTVHSSLGSFFSTAVILIICPFAGYLSDKYGRKAVLFLSIAAYGIAAAALFPIFLHSPTFASYLSLQIGSAIFMSFLWGSGPIVVFETFPVEVRSTAAALTYNLAVLLFGGLAPLLNAWLIKETGNNLVPLYYVLVSATISFVSVILLPKASRKPYQDSCISNSATNECIKNRKSRRRQS